MKRTAALLFLLAVAIAVACGNVSSKTPDARMSDTPAGGAHDCVVDTDTFDNGCTLAP